MKIWPQKKTKLRKFYYQFEKELDVISEAVHKNEEYQISNEKILAQNLELENQLKVMMEELKIAIFQTNLETCTGVRGHSIRCPSSIYERQSNLRYQN